MDRSKLSLLTIGLILLSTLGILVAAQAAPLDPLAEFRTADGGLTIPGGKFTPELQKLLFPGEAATSYWTYSAARSAYPTLVLLGEEHKIVRAPSRPARDLRPLGTDSLKVFFDALLRLPAGIVSFFDSINPVGTAAAADRFLDLSNAGCVVTTIATDTDCWSTTSGGAGGASVPGAADRAMFDNLSGAGTGTMDAAMNVLEWCSADSCNGAGTAFTGTLATGNFALTIGTGGYDQAGTFTAGSSTITVSGNWTSSTGTFTIGTSTVVIAANSTVVGATAAVANFYNFTIQDNASVTLTTSHIRAANVMTINTATSGVLSMKTSGQVILSDGTNVVTPLVVSVGGRTDWCDGVDGSGIVRNFNLNSSTGTAANIPSADYDRCGWDIQTAVASTFTATAQGNIAAKKMGLGRGSGTDATVLVMGAFNLTTRQTETGQTSLAMNRTAPGAVTFTSGTLDAGTDTETAVAISGTSYISWGSSTGHVVRGEWANSTTSASWDAGTGTVTFNAEANETMTFAGAGLAEAEFNNLTFNSTSVVAQTFTMSTRALRIAGTMTITDSVSTTTLNTSNLNAQASVVDVLASGILLAGTGDLLAMTTFNIDGSMTMDTIVVGNMNISRTAGTGTIDITLWTAWAVGCAGAVDVRWTFNPSVTTDTLQFVLEDVCTATSYSLERDSIVIDTQSSGAGTTVTFSEAGGWSSHTMEIDEAVLDRFLVLGDLGCTPTAIATDDGCWASSSGGVGGVGVPTISNGTFMDAASGAGTGTADASMSMLSLDMTGFTGIFALSTFSMTVSGGVTVGAAAAIQFGSSSAHVVGGSWTNSSIDADWSAGSGTVQFTSATGGAMTFAGAGLAEDEFNSVVFESSAGSAQIFTMAVRDLRVGGTITISDASSTTALNAGALNLIFDRITIVTGGRLTMDGMTMQTFDIDTSAGTITMTGITVYNESTTDANGTEAQWDFNPSDAGATITITDAGVVVNATYRLLRDGLTVAESPSGGAGSVTFAVTGGWSPHTMVIQFVSAPGGGTPPPDVTPEPDQQPAPGQSVIAAATPVNVAIFLMALGAVLFFIGAVSRVGWMRFWGTILFVIGLFVLLFALGYL